LFENPKSSLPMLGRFTIRNGASRKARSFATKLDSLTSASQHRRFREMNSNLGDSSVSVNPYPLERLTDGLVQPRPLVACQVLIQHVSNKHVHESEDPRLVVHCNNARIDGILQGKPDLDRGAARRSRENRNIELP